MKKIYQHRFGFYLTVLLAAIVFGLVGSGHLRAQIGAASGAESIESLKSSLRGKIQRLEDQIEQYRQTISEFRQKEISLEGQLLKLSARQKKLQLEIDATNLELEDVSATVTFNENQIAELEKSLESKKEALARQLRSFYQMDDLELWEIIFGDFNLAKAFDIVTYTENLQEELLRSLDEARELKSKLESSRLVLEEKKEDLNSLRALQRIQLTTLKKQRLDHGYLLAQMRSEQRTLSTLIRSSKDDIKKIREQLFTLEGVGVSMSFEEALRYARLAGRRTGVRPALLLAVLKRESQWGANVGRGSWREDMNPKQHEAFLKVTSRLGLNPDEVPVSRRQRCADGSVCGWGGALGPAQFLPATWLKYEPEVARLTGKNPPSPWAFEDAITAAGVKLRNDGASVGTSEGEWRAVMIFFAGRNWQKPRYQFYGDSVMELAQSFQEQIDLLEQAGY